jgi:hypothetical protein
MRDCSFDTTLMGKELKYQVGAMDNVDWSSIEWQRLQ